MLPAWSAATQLPLPEFCVSANTPTSGVTGTGSGFVAVLGTVTAGSGGISGTYGGVTLTGGTGTGATANITVSGGGVTVVAVLNPGVGYVVGDVLSATSSTIGGTTGFSVPVSSVAINSALAGGTAAFYQPNTLTFKQTWTSSSQATLNTNPVILDANGCALVYGTGTYRVIVKDVLGNTIYDQQTSDVSANNNIFWAGSALNAGTPNAIQVTDAGFSGTDGSIINFTPIASNTGPTTFNPSNYFGNSPVSIVKDTASGPVALSGGEIAVAAGGSPNIVSLEYSASQSNFHILNLISAASSPSTPLCGAVGLKITNDGTFPNTTIDITADQINMQTKTGGYITRGSPSSQASFSVNFTTSGAGGLDTGNVAAATVYNIYAIDNGIAPTGLGSISATSPTMPSGYSYACRLGAVITDGSGNFYRTLQLGSRTQYKVTASTNTPAIPNIANGTAGTFSTTSPTWATASLTGIVPPTATEAIIAIDLTYKGASSAGVVQLAPSASYAGPAEATNGNFPWIMMQGTVTSFNNTVNILLEAQSVAWTSSAAGGAISCAGWKDKVNAS